MSKEERLEAYRRTVAIIAVFIGLILSFLVIRPFLVAIIGAALLSYLFYPMYKNLVKSLPVFLPKESIAAALTCLLIVLIVLIPMTIITVLLAREARDGYQFLKTVIESPELHLSLPPIIREQVGNLSQYKGEFLNVGNQLIEWAQNILKGVPHVVLSIFITVFSIYFFLKGGKEIHSFIQDFFPLPEGRYKQIFNRFDDLSRGMIMGQIVVGFVQGFLAWLAFFVLGVPNPVLWGFLTAIISIIPLMGAAMVWGPVDIYLFIVGYTTGVYWPAVALLFFGSLVISTIDNILKPKIVGDHAKVHPLIILFGILGGIELIGIPGILIGPMILTLFDVLMEMFRDLA
jgi:predicted PurR-regulated permease PerM